MPRWRLPCWLSVCLDALRRLMPALPVAVVAVGIALIVPIVFLPSSRTLWTAIDLWMTPADPLEFVRDPEDGTPG